MRDLKCPYCHKKLRTQSGLDYHILHTHELKEGLNRLKAESNKTERQLRDRIALLEAQLEAKEEALKEERIRAMQWEAIAIASKVMDMATLSAEAERLAKESGIPSKYWMDYLKKAQQAKLR